MKKNVVTVWCLVLSFTLLLCSCGKADQTLPKIQVDGISEGDTIKQETPPEDDDSDTDDTEIVLEHYNPNNAIFDDGQVTIRPYHVYWEGDVLIANCFVLNGTDHTVYNISVPSLIFSNEDGVIADGGFETLKNETGVLTVASKKKEKWTFRFEEDAVERAGADLKYLQTECTVRHSPLTQSSDNRNTNRSNN